MGACVGKSSGGGDGNGSNKRVTAVLEGGKSDHLFKIVFLGDAGVGKSSWILRCSENVFTGQPVSTIGEDFKAKVIDVDGVVVKNQLFDTAGSERFRTITSSYIRGASGAIIVYDISNRASFDNVRRWSDDATNMSKDSGKPFSILIIGNKSDLAAERAVQLDEGKALADSIGADFGETSAKDGQNIDALLKEFTKTLISQATGQI